MPTHGNVGKDPIKDGGLGLKGPILIMVVMVYLFNRPALGSSKECENRPKEKGYPRMGLMTHTMRVSHRPGVCADSYWVTCKNPLERHTPFLLVCNARPYIQGS